jgi:hypothetical protein
MTDGRVEVVVRAGARVWRGDTSYSAGRRLVVAPRLAQHWLDLDLVELL